MRSLLALSLSKKFLLLFLTALLIFSALLSTAAIARRGGCPLTFIHSQPSADQDKSPPPPQGQTEEYKYFQEAGINAELSHYDARFYRGIVSYNEHRAVMRSLMRSYLRTFARLRLETWLAHGTLLGWWWNGRILPWDFDVDAQVTGATLALLAERYNGSLHEYVDDDDDDDDEENHPDQQGTDGAGQQQQQQHHHHHHHHRQRRRRRRRRRRQQQQQQQQQQEPRPDINRTNRTNRTRRYLLDVNPFATSSPGRGTGANVIDARWVDVDTGMYVDVTAVMERNWTSVPLPPSATFPSSSSSSSSSSGSDGDDDGDGDGDDGTTDPRPPSGPPGLLSCKNAHFYRAGDLFPLRETAFEGVPALVPWAYEPVLVAEYGPQSLVLTEWER
ncbi:hypothetical protein VTG60DRAFT_2912 [Thermothelomyces hinnuleus]